MSASFEITKDNRKEVMHKVNLAIERALTIIGGKAESYAKDNITRQKAVDTGRLRSSVSYNVNMQGESKFVEIGTNVEYAPYIECGTGSGYDGSLGGTGRKTPWIWNDESGNGHLTYGMEARPFIKPAVADHLETYQNIIKTELGEL